MKTLKYMQSKKKIVLIKAVLIPGFTLSYVMVSFSRVFLWPLLLSYVICSFTVCQNNWHSMKVDKSIDEAVEGSFPKSGK